MEFHLNKSSLLEHLPYSTYSFLIKILERDNGLQKIKEKCPDLYKMIDWESPSVMSCKSPAEIMLGNLIEKRCNIETFTNILRESELYYALAIFLTEKMKVIKQPTENSQNNTLHIKRKQRVELDFQVSGIPPPTYCWYRNRIPLQKQNDSKLLIETYCPGMSGDYYCEAIQIFSTQKVDVIRSDTIKLETVKVKCVIIKKPPHEMCVKTTAIPQEVELTVVADGFPAPQYHWIHNNTPIEIFSKTIKIKNEMQYQGEYRCIVSNEVSDDIVVKTYFKVSDDFYLYPVFNEIVEEKVALLIANENYNNHDPLLTPKHDINAIKEILEAKGFLIITISDLTFQGMNNAIKYFSKMCVRNCYAVFYFAGHGFELGEKYLMPTDAADFTKLKREQCISENQILKMILECSPKLFLSILDMCLKFPDRDKNEQIFEEKAKPYEYSSNRNLIQAYSTSVGASAFDKYKKNINPKHSTYNTLLQAEMQKNIPILQMLLNVNKEFEKTVKLMKSEKLNQQMPSLYFNISQDYSLTVNKIGNATTKKLWNFISKH